MVVLYKSDVLSAKAVMLRFVRNWGESHVLLEAGCFSIMRATSLFSWDKTASYKRLTYNYILTQQFVDFAKTDTFFHRENPENPFIFSIGIFSVEPESVKMLTLKTTNFRSTPIHYFTPSFRNAHTRHLEPLKCIARIVRYQLWTQAFERA